MTEYSVSRNSKGCWDATTQQFNVWINAPASWRLSRPARSDAVRSRRVWPAAPAPASQLSSGGARTLLCPAWAPSARSAARSSPTPEPVWSSPPTPYSETERALEGRTQITQPTATLALCVSYPLDLLHLLVELVEGLAVFLSHLHHHLLVNFSLVLQILLQMSHFSLTLRPAGNTRWHIELHHKHFISYSCCWNLQEKQQFNQSLQEPYKYNKNDFEPGREYYMSCANYHFITNYK